jgi:lipopolysaccharide/colanic/teichoic acid biosynthesis glycosyltransferase
MENIDRIRGLAFDWGRTASLPPTCRGLRQAINCDCVDTRNTSFWLDLKILFTTLRHEFVAAD